VRIGIYDPYLDDLGGGEKYMIAIGICLAKDHRVTVFWDNKEDLEKLKERFLLDLSSINLAKNIFSSKFGFLKRILETRKYDAIIVLSDGSIPFSLSKKLFIHIQQPLGEFPINSFKSRIKLSRINAFFCNSQFTKSFIDKGYNVKSLVIYPPVEIFRKEVKKENIILHVGRFRVKNVKTEDYKKQSFMIEMFKRMVKNGLKNWSFVLAVSVSEKDREIFNALPEKTEGFPIKFLINHDNRKLWDIYNRSKIYWHASGFGEDLTKNPEYAEHFGISTVEAMGAGCVPVVINAGGQKEIVENGENGFLWDTEEELINRTFELVRNSKLREKLSYAAQERAKVFAGDRFCREIKEMIAK